LDICELQELDFEVEIIHHDKREFVEHYHRDHETIEYVQKWVEIDKSWTQYQFTSTHDGEWIEEYDEWHGANGDYSVEQTHTFPRGFYYNLNWQNGGLWARHNIYEFVWWSYEDFLDNYSCWTKTCRKGHCETHECAAASPAILA